MCNGEFVKVKINKKFYFDGMYENIEREKNDTIQSQHHT